MRPVFPRVTLLPILVGFAFLGACGGEKQASSQADAAEAGSAAASSTAAPAVPGQLADARRVLDLAALVLPEGAELAAPASLSTLRFTLAAPIPDAFDTTRALLGAQGWQVQGDAQVSDSSASALMTKAGWTLSLSLMPQRAQGRTMVAVQQHGNLSLATLPKPQGATVVYEGPHTGVYRVPATAEQVADAMHQLLIGDGWEPYGAANAQSVDYRRRALRLGISPRAMPGASDQTTLSINLELLSAEIPAVPGAQSLQFDSPSQALRFLSDTPFEQLVEAYDAVARNDGWTRSLDEPARIEGKRVMTWRNPEQDMLRLDYSEPRGGRQNASLTYQSREQIAEMNRRLDAQADAYKAAQGR